jgi:hypothetical protein
MYYMYYVPQKYIVQSGSGAQFSHQNHIVVLNYKCTAGRWNKYLWMQMHQLYYVLCTGAQES